MTRSQQAGWPSPVSHHMHHLFCVELRSRRQTCGDHTNHTPTTSTTLTNLNQQTFTRVNIKTFEASFVTNKSNYVGKFNRQTGIPDSVNYSPVQPWARIRMSGTYISLDFNFSPELQSSSRSCVQMSAYYASLVLFTLWDNRPAIFQSVQIKFQSINILLTAKLNS